MHCVGRGAWRVCTPIHTGAMASRLFLEFAVSAGVSYIASGSLHFPASDENASSASCKASVLGLSLAM